MALQKIGPEKQILPKQNNPFAHLHHIYFMRLIGPVTVFDESANVWETIVFVWDLMSNNFRKTAVLKKIYELQTKAIPTAKDFTGKFLGSLLCLIFSRRLL